MLEKAEVEFRLLPIDLQSCGLLDVRFGAGSLSRTGGCVGHASSSRLIGFFRGMIRFCLLHSSSAGW